MNMNVTKSADQRNLITMLQKRIKQMHRQTIRQADLLKAQLKIQQSVSQEFLLSFPKTAHEANLTKSISRVSFKKIKCKRKKRS